jgi:secreted PhoX family phosphatase
MDASVVLGEPDLNAANCSVNQNGMNQTEGLTFDQQGNLWVTDRGANRVLEFTPPFSNGMPATTVIGQAILAQSGLRPTITDSTIPTASRS